MGSAAGSIGSGASILSLGLSAAGAIAKGQGTKAADDFQAAQAEEAAKFGRLQADLGDTTSRERLVHTIGNIEAIRAAAKTDITSPTEGAVEDWQRELSERQRLASDATLRTQAAVEDASAAYLRQAGDYAVTQSYLQAAGGILGGVGKYALSLPGGSSSGGDSSDPTKIGALY
jgi:hypothetical protein